MNSPIRKLLVCNRGEIAIRIFRTCTEMGIRTVAVYSHEDRFSLHRYKADEAYQLGEAGQPVQSYLDIEAILRVALETGADAIHPGYGFLSERVDLRDRVEACGLRFVGPESDTLHRAGDKTEAVALARELGIPTVSGGEPVSDAAEARVAISEVGLPALLKASFGGGGRGMRVVRDLADVESAFDEASSEAKASFGKPDLYVEKYIERPKHLEVQLLGDGSGEVVHLYERDCSVQRRHQKVIEIGPAIAVDSAIRETLYDYALQYGRALKLKSAATAEFLLSQDGEIYFIEMNPRIQVEHTVTEELTGIDIVRCQIEIANGNSLADIGLVQEQIECSGAAIQCRVTTEDPTEEFRPDYGRVVAFRTGAGFGIRVDAGSIFPGVEVQPFYDSMLVKITARGRTLEEAAGRMRRSLLEFRIRGVKTNTQFLVKLLENETFLKGEARTSFLEENPELFDLPARRDRANKLLRFIGDVTINGHEQMADLIRPVRAAAEAKPPALPVAVQMALPGDEAAKPPPGWRDKFLQLDRKDFLQAIRDEWKLLITDTTFRDAHQSLLATRVRTRDMIAPARALSHYASGLFSLEMWGGATFDVCLRFLREDPWERVAQLREAVPNILFQMLIRGANVVGYSSYPDNVVKSFVREAHDAGIDVFRIFDCFNNLDQMRVSLDAVRESGALAEVCICYTGDLLDEERHRAKGLPSKYDLNYYVDLAKQCVKVGADMLAIKDMAGLLRPYSAEKLIRALRDEIDVPIHLHTHDTAGGQIATFLKASEVGVDIVDCAFASMSGVTSQPSLEGLVGALHATPRDSGLSLPSLTPFSTYWENVRTWYAPFESDLHAATGEVYLNEIPGGQYSNFRPQAASLGLADQWEELKLAYADVDRLFGRIIKVTPSSKVVGDLAIFMVSNGLSIEQVREQAKTLNFPASVVDFFRGSIGTPPGGFDEEMRQDVLHGEAPMTVRPGDSLPPVDIAKAQSDAAAMLQSTGNGRDAMSLLLYPHVFKDYAEAQKEYGDVSVLPSLTYFYGMEAGEEITVDIEAGKRLIIKLVAISDINDDGDRTIFYELNGQPRNILIRDRNLAPEQSVNEKADPEQAGHVASPLAGALVNIAVEEGQTVEAGDAVCTIEAMKMQTVVSAPVSGTMLRIVAPVSSRVDVGDLLMEIETEK